MRPLIVMSSVFIASLCLAYNPTKNVDQIIELKKEEAKDLIETFTGWHLKLEHLPSIDKDVAYELAKFEGGSLILGLTKMDKDIAHELQEFKGGWLGLPSLKSIDKDVALELIQNRAYLDIGLTAIDKDVAHELAKFEYGILYLDSLTSINRDVALELRKFKGGKLNIGHLKSIEPEVSNILKKNPYIEF